ncbi:MAG: hypothetical protein HYX68_02055 [Planctomycetes bacterium]|nr:hypothetical protein [Planctomycetota bacterium]
MRMRIRWILLFLGLMLIPGGASAQTDVAPVIFTGPLSHIPYDGPGVYVAFQMLYMKTNRPLGAQQIATRGWYDLDGSVTGTVGGYVGSKEEALTTNMVRGPGNYQPGWDFRLGYKFQNNITVEIGWRHLVQAEYSAVASLIPPTFNSGIQFENTFLSAPVSNFTNDWAGAPQNIPGISGASTYGIFNAASIMKIDFTQRYDIYEINARLPIWQTANHRSYGLLGPRITWIWDRFRWKSVDTDAAGDSGPFNQATYSNTISNRMYGIHAGFGNDWFLGSTPIGGFAFNLDVEGGLYLNLVKARAAWERGDRGVGASRGRRFSSLVPGAELRAGFKWYPWEAISIEVAYDIQTYFNTIASHEPVDFNMGSVDPQYDAQFFRWFYGLRIGIGFVF